ATTSFSTDRNRKYTILLFSSRSTTTAQSTDALTHTHRTTPPLSTPFRYTGVAASCRSSLPAADILSRSLPIQLLPSLPPSSFAVVSRTRGLDNSGKTTIVLKINGEDTSVISPTLGFNIKTITYQKYTLNIWDVGGQRTIRSYWRNYFEQTDGLVWVVDSSDLRRLDDCKMELDNLLKEERLSGASLLILANKQDINGALTPTEIAKVLNLEAMDKTRHWKIVGCSAYTGEGLLEGFDWLVQDIASRIYLLD
ncbi:hypothetical protein CUMW_100390, partial [Citrus unshiu]